MVSGSEARALPGIEPDHKTILTNRSILELPSIPKSLIVVGAGAVGVEFASIYNSFGTQVTILEALPRVVPVEDEEISAELEKSFKKKNINIFTKSMVESVKKDSKGVTVSFKDKDGKAQTLQAEKLLLAVGRKPMTEGCGLEKSKAKLDRGFVEAGPSWRPPSRACTRLVTLWPDFLSWRMPPGWKGLPRSRTSPGNSRRRS